MCCIKDKFVVYKSWILIFSRSLIRSKTWNNYIVKNNWILVLEEIWAIKDYFCGEGLAIEAYICIGAGIIHCSSKQWHVLSLGLFFLLIICPFLLLSVTNSLFVNFSCISEYYLLFLLPTVILNFFVSGITYSFPLVLVPQIPVV